MVTPHVYLKGDAIVVSATTDMTCPWAKWQLELAALCREDKDKLKNAVTLVEASKGWHNTWTPPPGEVTQAEAIAACDKGRIAVEKHLTGNLVITDEVMNDVYLFYSGRILWKHYWRYSGIEPEYRQEWDEFMRTAELSPVPAVTLMPPSPPCDRTPDSMLSDANIRDGCMTCYECQMLYYEFVYKEAEWRLRKAFCKPDMAARLQDMYHTYSYAYTAFLLAWQKSLGL